MAWTTPKTWAAGDVVTAAQLNTNIRDNMNALAGVTLTGSLQTGSVNTGVANAQWGNQNQDWRIMSSALTLSLTTKGGAIIFFANLQNVRSQTTANTFEFGTQFDGSANRNLYTFENGGDRKYTVQIWDIRAGVAAGSHTISLIWKRLNLNYNTYYREVGAVNVYAWELPFGATS